MKINTAIKKYAIGLAFAGAVALGSGTASAVTFQYGDFDPGDTPTSSPGSSYDFAGLGFSFTTNPVAFKWGYYLGDNPNPQDATDIQGYVESWTGLDLTSVVEQLDKIADNATGFSTTVLAEIIAVHVGKGEFVFIFDTATLFTLSNYTHCGDCPDGVVKVGGLSNFRTYNFTDNDNNQGPPEVPLPAALPLFAAGLGGLTWLSRSRKRKLPA